MEADDYLAPTPVYCVYVNDAMGFRLLSKEKSWDSAVACMDIHKSSEIAREIRQRAGVLEWTMKLYRDSKGETVHWVLEEDLQFGLGKILIAEVWIECMPS